MKTNFERSITRVLDKVTTGVLTSDQAFTIIESKINMNTRRKLQYRFIAGFFAGIGTLLFFLFYFG